MTSATRSGTGGLGTGEPGWGTLNLAPIGNCTVAALVDRQARFVWACLPRLDGDPFFPALLRGEDPAGDGSAGHWSIDLDGYAFSRQDYVRNSAVLRTILVSDRGDEVEVVDFAPRFARQGRVYRPTAFVRVIRPLAGAPRIRVRLRPMADWGGSLPEITSGSNHVRYLARPQPMRLTTDIPVGHILDERWHRLEGPRVMFLGPDEPFSGDLSHGIRQMYDATVADWQTWVRGLALPLEWQKVVIRAAIALKLCVHEETGAIVAALTTSVPEAANSGRNWDYRYCWIRDAYYTVQALNRLGALDVLENYLGFLRNIVDSAAGGHIQPLYGIGYEAALPESIAPALPGYRGMGPVRVGNQAHEHLQHDAYGQIILSSVQAFFDERLFRPGNLADFEALEQVGDRAFALHDQPDAGLWEFRTRARIHTYSALMCWAACDRLANAAGVLGLPERQAHWAARADTVRARIEAEAWSREIGSFSASFGTAEIDASLLQMIDLKFLDAADKRFTGTFAAVEKALRRGDHMLRYIEPDDFGQPETAFNFCTFWLIEALHLSGRTEEARRLFETTLERLTASGLLSEDSDIETGELWGNFPQTYSLVGLINCAGLLSRPWTSVR
ncbi:glycoside hydrolase family 15 protein [Sandaracinobacter sp. RS1-74]|uniref:glycoside hydrolase family 15 protein n=1 Tax=Sandaracinobacteroides sayramensis TaxID=2913411 RepID=UPI001EDC027A|nr:glycoside hydrolase family 15 protein [Sandaracinobacteroides sayramensis]MCG2842611.1 glycoside hydrolase family 15 protein [Sandaracinobacteroides sayramensis]